MSPVPAPRSAAISRRTGETEIELRLRLDGPVGAEVATGVGGLDHLLSAFARHGGICLSLRASGDAGGTGAHHLAEDCGLALGEAIRLAVYGCTDVPSGQSAPSVMRFGEAGRPMDEALVTAHVDLCGRGGAFLQGFEAGGEFGGVTAADWVAFCEGLARAGMFAMHLRVLAGRDWHHILEAAAKAAGAALGGATRPSQDTGAETSTKGSVEVKVRPW